MNRGPKLQRISEHVWILPFNSPKDRPNLGYILGDEKGIGIILLACMLCTAKSLQGLKRAINWRRYKQKWKQIRIKQAAF